MPSDGGLFIINPPEGNSYIPTGETKELNCYSEGTSDLSGGENLQFIISEAKNVERPSWAVTECAADGVPLIMRGDNGGQKVCVFTFDIHNSDLPLSLIHISIPDHLMWTFQRQRTLIFPMDIFMRTG